MAEIPNDKSKLLLSSFSVEAAVNCLKLFEANDVMVFQ